mmetsp:Transcript_75579/g.216404  ORF Transcript_75579/g.216404 Transcript_75579/m.216404 type:complete len:221 (+) Transcript_75579:1214-1876(+)
MDCRRAWIRRSGRRPEWPPGPPALFGGLLARRGGFSGHGLGGPPSAAPSQSIGWFCAAIGDFQTTGSPGGIQEPQQRARRPGVQFGATICLAAYLRRLRQHRQMDEQHYQACRHRCLPCRRGSVRQRVELWLCSRAQDGSLQRSGPLQHPAQVSRVHPHGRHGPHRGSGDGDHGDAEERLARKHLRSVAAQLLPLLEPSVQGVRRRRCARVGHEPRGRRG